jgi:hypothetical protein
MATWSLPKGDYTYFKGRISEISYNQTTVLQALKFTCHLDDVIRSITDKTQLANYKILFKISSKSPNGFSLGAKKGFSLKTKAFFKFRCNFGVIYSLARHAIIFTI